VPEATQVNRRAGGLRQAQANGAIIDGNFCEQTWIPLMMPFKERRVGGMHVLPLWDTSPGFRFRCR
jgi:hypothetical protein